MRTLNDIFLPMGGTMSLETAGQVCEQVVIPEDGEIIAVIVNSNAAVSTVTTCDILLDGADSGVDLVIPAASADVGQECYTDAKCYVRRGQRLVYQSNGETTGTHAARFTTIIRR